jgi:hypothetical protein
MTAHRKTAALPRLPHPVPDLVDPDPADFETARNLGWTISTIQSPQHPVTQILRVSLHPCPSLRGTCSIAQMYILELEWL